ncbi:MAG: 5-formyltetrahydrofolate cyclo-ligase [Caldilineaceae bacterium]
MTQSIQTEWSGRHQGKDELRTEIWTRLLAEQAAIGQPVGHIPAFVGGDRAAARLAELPFWKAAHVIKCNPDTAQIPVRLRALQDGKTVYMAVPRLTQERCFVELRADELRDRHIALEDAASHQGAMQHGRLIAFDEMAPIDVVVTGCVAVSADGGRTGKGAGFADLDWACCANSGWCSPIPPL